MPVSFFRTKGAFFLGAWVNYIHCLKVCCFLLLYVLNVKYFDKVGKPVFNKCYSSFYFKHVISSTNIFNLLHMQVITLLQAPLVVPLGTTSSRLATVTGSASKYVPILRRREG